MFKNYFTTFLRNLFRYKVYSLTNILGLTVGLATSIFIFLWAADEVSYDRFHAQAERTYQILINDIYPDGRMDTYFSPTVMLGDVLQAEIPEIDEVVQTSWNSDMLMKAESKSLTETGWYASPNLFSVFSFPIVKGNDRNPLPDEKSIAVSEKLVKKFFGDRDPIGKTIQLNQQYDLTITSVFKDIPANSSLQFDFVISFELWKKENTWANHWRSGAMQTFITLNDKADVQAADSKVRTLIKTNCPDCSREAFLYPFSDLYLHNNFEDGKNAGGRIDQVILFSFVAIIILAMACINFTNLSTARASVRSREIGVRKTVGAGRITLGLQFIGESVLLSFLSLACAIVIIQLLLPAFNQITGKSILINFSDSVFLVGILSITFLCGVMAGIYPAVVLSSMKTAIVLKNNSSASLTGATLRRSLVVVQFAVSIVLISGCIVIFRQISFISNKNLGFIKENIIVIDQLEGSRKNHSSFKNDLLQIPTVRNVAFVGSNIFEVPITTADPVWPGRPVNSSLSFKVLRCDDGFLPTMEIKLIHGRNFTNVNNEDAANYVINESAMEAMGLSAANVIGTELEMWNGKGKIIGVTSDFINGNLRDATQPLILMFSTNNGSSYYIRTVDNVGTQNVLASIEKVSKKYDPDYPFQYSFLETNFSQEYRSESVLANLSLSFTIVAVVICCLGLFGLSTFTTERRIKELGIRKVFGASSGTLMLLLSRELLILVFVGLMIGCPIAWYFGSTYLAQFAYHFDLGLSVFALTVVLTLVISFGTVVFQTAQASMMNPVRSLRSE